MTRTDHCQDCKGGRLVPALGCACDGDGDTCTPTICTVRMGSGVPDASDRKVISGQSRSATGTANRPLPAATQVLELAERSLQAGSRFGPVQQRPLTATGLHFHQQPPLAATAANVPALPLVRDEEAIADSVSVGHMKDGVSSDTRGSGITAGHYG